MALTGAVVGSVLNRSLHLDLSRAFVYALALLCIGSFQEKKVPQGFPILPVLQIWILLSRMQFIRQIKPTFYEL